MLIPFIILLTIFTYTLYSLFKYEKIILRVMDIAKNHNTIECNQIIKECQTIFPFRNMFK